MGDDESFDVSQVELRSINRVIRGQSADHNLGVAASWGSAIDSKSQGRWEPLGRATIGQASNPSG